MVRDGMLTRMASLDMFKSSHGCSERGRAVLFS